ncbi:type VI secretion system lipoprotein TssJ [Massilia yuzhufengensis]|uniref:Type VI secretion system protein VasD n=1 Tax=Massilia yuzhufengensis TaxID=1164594 RepID=A0A1I1EGL3_9BURK|nr:type VI secretion system lipoprotein TssJ [Massilia yuzhufengensis]SFB84498.1 type VI secretion system protein VasD [Massilia yuzhufengensis]
MRTAFLLAALCCASLLSGCGSNGLASAALEATGLRKPPELLDSQKPPRTVLLRLHASPKLNVDKRGQPLALAVRVYKLRQKEAFEQAPYSAFLNPQAERDSLGADLLEVRELMLVPGQQLELTEKVSREAGHVAVVALFQRPADQRWRVTMTAAEAELTGLTVGLHACALTMGGSSQASMLSSVRCQ